MRHLAVDIAKSRVRPSEAVLRPLSKTPVVIKVFKANVLTVHARSAFSWRMQVCAVFSKLGLGLVELMV